MSTETRETQGLSPESALAFQRVMGRMPFGALIGAPTRFETVGQVTEWLDELSVRLTDFADRFHARTAELDELTSQRDAIRRFLGVDS